MKRIEFSKAIIQKEYDMMLLTMVEDSNWFRIDSANYPDVLIESIEYWHKIGVMSFSISSDSKRFKKDFNCDNKFISNFLK